MKRASLLLLLIFAAAGCESSREIVDPEESRNRFHYYRSFRFHSENQELNFELAQLATAAEMEKEYGYVSTREGRWNHLSEVLAVEYKLTPALEDLSEYLAASDVEVPLREVMQMITAIGIYKPCSDLADIDNSLTFNDPDFNEKFREYLSKWREFNRGIRAYIVEQQSLPLKDDVMEFILRVYYTNYDTLWGLPRKGIAPPGDETRFFTD